ncbi:MAG: hypothetical protein ABIN94_22870, partial [Ferruginibacter sp.]
MRKSAIICFFLFLSGGMLAQSVEDTGSIDISTLKQSQDITDQCAVYLDINNTAQPANIAKKAWQPLSSTNIKKYIPDAWITKPVYLKYTLKNNGDSIKNIFFIAGSNMRSMNIYKLVVGALPEEIKNESRKDGFQPLQ